MTLIKTSVLTIILLVLVGASVTSYQINQLSEFPYSEFESPDGEYKIVVHTYPRYWSAIGDAGGSSGLVMLKNKSGEILESKPVATVQIISR